MRKRTQRALMPPRSNSYLQRFPLSLIAASATVQPREVDRRREAGEIDLHLAREDPAIAVYDVVPHVPRGRREGQVIPIHRRVLADRGRGQGGAARRIGKVVRTGEDLNAGRLADAVVEIF